MTWLAWFGHSGDKQPFTCVVTYRLADGQETEGRISLWSEDLRSALQAVHDLLAEHQPAIRAVIALREES